MAAMTTSIPVEYNLSTLASNSCNSESQVAVQSDFEYINGIIVSCLFSVVAVVGLIGNLLVIIVVISNKQMRNTTNILIISLAIADLCFIIFCVPFTAVSMMVTVYPFGSTWCQLVNYMQFVTAYVSIFTLVLMSCDRYLAVVHAVAAMSHRTERNAIIAVITTWTIFLIANIPIFFFYELIQYTHECQLRVQCLIPEHREAETKSIFYVFFFLGYLVPLLLVIVLYGLMVYRLLWSVPRGLSQSSETIRSKRRVTRMIIIVIVIFALCWLPNHIQFIYLQVHGHPKNQFFVAFQTFGRMMAYTNSCINPILYAFLSENFRKGFRKILCMAQGARNNFDVERTNIRPLLHASKPNGSKNLLDVDDTVKTRSTGRTSVNGL